MFLPVLHGCVGYVYCYVGRRLLSIVFAITDRRDMGLYEVSLSMSLLGFAMGTLLSNFHMCGFMLVWSERKRTLYPP